MTESTKRLRPDDRLRSRLSFKDVFDARQSVRNRDLTLYYAANGRDHPRLGLSVGRRLGNAVRRNRIKRVLREAFRHHRDDIPGALDIVLIPRSGRTAVDHARMVSAFRHLAKKLAAGMREQTA